MVNCQPAEQQVNPDTQPEPPILLGLTDRTAFQQDEALSWFQQNYDAYQINWEFLPRADSSFKTLTFTIVMGTWCPDSRREVPRFYKILDTLGIADDQIILINVDRSKRTPNGEETGLDIQNIPTFIIYWNGTEIGRIVESPEETLESDLEFILLGMPMEPPDGD